MMEGIIETGCCSSRSCLNISMPPDFPPSFGKISRRLGLAGQDEAHWLATTNCTWAAFLGHIDLVRLDGIGVNVEFTGVLCIANILEL